MSDTGVMSDIWKLTDENKRLRANHKDCVETKRRTETRLRAALDGLQAVYTLCAARPSNADPEAMLKAIYQMSGDAFEEATREWSRAKTG